MSILSCLLKCCCCISNYDEVIYILGSDFHTHIQWIHQPAIWHVETNYVSTMET